MCVLVTQSCPTVCDPINCSLPGSSVHEISQAKILEWLYISFSRESSWPRSGTWFSCIAGRSFPPEPPGKKVSWKESIENWVATICYVLLVLTEKYMLWCTQEPPIFTCTTQIEYSPSECAMMVVFKIIAPNSSIIGSLDALKLESYYSRVEDS